MLPCLGIIFYSGFRICPIQGLYTHRATAVNVYILTKFVSEFVQHSRIYDEVILDFINNFLYNPLVNKLDFLNLKRSI